MDETIPVEHRLIDGNEHRAGGEALDPRLLVLQTPAEFRDDFVAASARATRQVGLEVMQFEVGDNTQPMFKSLMDARDRGVDTRFHYDRVARRHIRAGDSEALVALGRTMLHRGDKPSLRQANSAREEVIDQMETSGITDPNNRRRNGSKRLSHNHAKLAIVDDEAWFGTMNLREIDFEMSNFMVKVKDPKIVEVLKHAFDLTEDSELGQDRTYTESHEDGRPKTEVLLDVGAKDQSIIYDKAIEMAASLKEGDELVMISQWPPVKVIYGQLAETLDQQMDEGAKVTFLMSPEQDLHPSKRASTVLQKAIDKKQGRSPNMTAENLPRRTHAKAIMITRASGEREVLFGSHNFTSATVRNGTRELAMWTNDPEMTEQIAQFLTTVRQELVVN